MVAGLPRGPLLDAGSDAQDSAGHVSARMTSTAARVVACEQAARRVSADERRRSVLEAVEPLLGNLRADADRLDQLLAAAAELLAADGRQDGPDGTGSSLASARLEEAVAALQALAAGLDEVGAGRRPA